MKFIKSLLSLQEQLKMTVIMPTVILIVVVQLTLPVLKKRKLIYGNLVDELTLAQH